MYTKIQIGAGGAILRHNKGKKKKILLLKRISSTEKFPDFYTFPAGIIEPEDESVKETAKREVHEESNLGVEEKIKPFGFYESFWKETRVISLVFLGEWIGEVKIQEDEISSFGWFTYAEAIKLDLAFAYRQVIEDLHERALL